MDIANLVLEYLKVILTAPVMFSLIAGVVIHTFKIEIEDLINRIGKITLPGGTELSTQQSTRTKDEETQKPPEPPDEPIQGLPANLPQEQRTIIEQLIRSHIATAYLWEYRYLNYFLARGTQMVLDWLIGLPQPTTYAHYNAFWIPIAPSAVERQSRINALQAHHLVQYDEQTGMITVTEKGREYQEWRGALPPPNPNA